MDPSQFRPIGLGVIYISRFDLVTNQPITFGTAVNALIQGLGLGLITAPKIIIHDVGSIGPFGNK